MWSLFCSRLKNSFLILFSERKQAWANNTKARTECFKTKIRTLDEIGSDLEGFQTIRHFRRASALAQSTRLCLFVLPNFKKIEKFSEKLHKSRKRRINHQINMMNRYLICQQKGTLTHALVITHKLRAPEVRAPSIAATALDARCSMEEI